MRVAFLLALVPAAARSVKSAPSCELDSTGAVSSAIDSALYIWASSKRCSPPLADNIKCERDLTSAIEAVTATAGAIAGMVGSCGGEIDKNMKCALAVNSLVSATAGLASAGGKVADFCGKQDYSTHMDRTTTLGKCTIHGGGSINALFDAQQTIRSLSKRCVPSEKKCIVGLIDVVTVVSSLGAHIAGAASFCQEAKDGTVNGKGQCASGILASIAHLSYMARIGMGIEKACSPEATRLYLEGRDLADKAKDETAGDDDKSSGALAFLGSLASVGISKKQLGSLDSLGLFVAAALPITGLLSVVAGMRLAKSRQQQSARDVEQDELLVAVEE